MMADLATAAGQDPHLLLRRPRGKAIYTQLELQLSSVAEGEMLLVAFSQDQDCDASFVDETLVKLGQKLVDGEFGEKGVALAGLNDGLRLTLSSTLLFRREDAKKKKEEFNLVFLVFDCEANAPDWSISNWSIIGHLEQNLLEVLQLLARRESLSAADLVGELGLEISSASMRLKRLHERRLVRREYRTMANGREFVYLLWK